jgi:hypothetical protein
VDSDEPDRGKEEPIMLKSAVYTVYCTLYTEGKLVQTGQGKFSVRCQLMMVLHELISMCRYVLRESKCAHYALYLVTYSYSDAGYVTVK